MVADRVDDLAGRAQCHLEHKWRKAWVQFIAFEESTAQMLKILHSLLSSLYGAGVDELFQLVQVLL